MVKMYVQFLDVSKAFDKVWHEGLLYKLENVGIKGSLLCWLKSYLLNRNQFVVLNGQASELRYINSGVPQGSILGPLLFLVYVNDINVGILSDINLFADDTSLSSEINSHDSVNKLNGDLSTLSQWAKRWLVTFNAVKTELVIFSKKRIVNKPNLVLDNTPINHVNIHKHLGILLSGHLDWHTHISEIVAKANKVLNILQALSYIIPRLGLDTLQIDGQIYIRIWSNTI